MKRTRLHLALATATASVLLLAACSTPAAEPTTEPANDPGIGDVPELRSQAPLPEPADDPAPTPTPGQIPEGYGVVFDDTGVLSVVLPEDWADVDGRPFTTGDGREWASIIATPDAAAYPTDWSVAGIEFSGTAIGEQLPADVQTSFLNDIASPLKEACSTGVDAQPYDDGLYVGYYSNFGECDGGDTFGIAVVAQDPQFKHFVFLRGKFVTEQDKGQTFDLVFTTFQSVQGLDKAGASGSRTSAF